MEPPRFPRRLTSIIFGAALMMTGTVTLRAVMENSISASALVSPVAASEVGLQEELAALRQIRRATVKPTVKPKVTAKPVRQDWTLPTPMSPSQVVALGRRLNSQRFGDRFWPALYSLWSKESGWNLRANSGEACGIPQAHPCSKLPGFPNNPAAQIKWGLNYIASRYGNPAKAWEFWRAHNWY